jgi:hypothetical protein
MIPNAAMSVATSLITNTRRPSADSSPQPNEAGGACGVSRVSAPLARSTRKRLLSPRLTSRLMTARRPSALTSVMVSRPLPEPTGLVSPVAGSSRKASISVGLKRLVARVSQRPSRLQP